MVTAVTKELQKIFENLGFSDPFSTLPLTWYGAKPRILVRMFILILAPSRITHRFTNPRRACQKACQIRTNGE